MNLQEDKDKWNILIIFSPTNQDSLLLCQQAIQLFKDQLDFCLYSLASSYLQNTTSIPQNLKPCPKIDYTLSIGQDQALLKAFSLISNNKKINSPVIAISDEPIISCYSHCHIEEVITNLMESVRKKKVKCKEIMNFDLISQEKKQIIRTFTGHLEIHREMNEGVVRLNIYVRFQERDFMLLAPMWGDGIVISTPFGSTGRSMSLNGPVIHKNLQSIMLLPICPLSLNFRPIILPASTEILIEVDESSRASALLFSDSQATGQIKKNERIVIRRASKKTRMVTGLTKLSSSEAWIIRLHEGISWAQHFGATKPPIRIPNQKIEKKGEQSNNKQ